MKSYVIPHAYPHRSAERPELTPIEYDLACSEWARGLSETNLRSLASDYMRGVRDESTEDAYEEYQRRERLGMLSEQKSISKSLSARKSRSHHRSSK